MKKKICGSYEELMEYLTVHVRGCAAPIAIIGGHYALNAEGEAAVNLEDKGSFGVFPKLTLDLAARLVQKGREAGNKVELALIVDDHSQMRDSRWYKFGSPSEQAEEIRAMVERYFKEFSLPKEYLPILEKYGLAEKDIIHSEQGLPFQETYYRELFQRETGLDPGCAGEYRLILEELARKGVRKVIAFIPLRCQGPTCIGMEHYFCKEDNPPLTVVNVCLSSNEANETPEQLLEEMLDTVGGIVVMRAG